MQDNDNPSTTPLNDLMDGPTQGIYEVPPTKHRHSRRFHWPIVVTAILACLFGVIIGVSGSHSTTKVVTRTITIAGPTVTQTQTVTATPSAAPGQVLLKHSGSGNWNSQTFQVGSNSPQLVVVFSFYNNASFGSSDNFIADLVSNDDQQNIANVIQPAGGGTTNVYPDTSSGDTTYHLSVQATGNWSFTVTEAS